MDEMTRHSFGVPTLTRSRFRTDPQIACIVWNGCVDGPNRGYLGIVADEPRDPAPDDFTAPRHDVQQPRRQRALPTERAGFRERRANPIWCHDCGKLKVGLDVKFANCQPCRVKRSAAYQVNRRLARMGQA